MPRPYSPRMLSETVATFGFRGIAPTDVAGFIVAQLPGALLATLLFRWLEGEPRHK